MVTTSVQVSERTNNSSLWNKITSVPVNFLAGGVAGAVSRTAVSPLERMKILFQIQVERRVEERKFRGIIPSLVKIGREEGVRGYFKGNGTNLARIVPYEALKFAAYEECKKLLHIPSDPKAHSPGKRLCAGAMAGMTATTLTYPLDLVRTRLSAQGEGRDRKYRNIRHAFRTIMKEEGGVVGLYKGLSPTLLGIAPYVGLNFAVYETLKGFAASHHDKDTDLPVTWRLAFGGVAGATAQLVTYPFDVVRRRMQMKGTMEHRFPYDSTWHAIVTIVRTEGAHGLYKGLLPNLLKVAPSVAIAFVTYEAVKSLLSPHQTSKS